MNDVNERLFQRAMDKTFGGSEELKNYFGPAMRAFSANFSELAVRECTNLCREERDQLWMDEDPESETVSLKLFQLELTILNHFGV